MVLEMEEVVRGGRIVENGSSSEGQLPPNPLAGAYKKCFSETRFTSPRSRSLMHLSTPFVTTNILESTLFDVSGDSGGNRDGHEIDFIPILRSGGWADIGFRRNMEDVYVCFDDFHNCHLTSVDGPKAFYGVFDGHGGKHAADFASRKLPKLIFENKDFPVDIEKVIASAFLQTDTAFAEACSLDSALDSGTTAIAALVVGSSLVVANAGDCRAVVSRRGKAIEMSRDHKPACTKERKRIEASGGFVDDGYLNGQLNVARALGDWHVEGMKDANGVGPLIAEPELMSISLTEEDEFLVIACDGIWDVFRSQNAVDFARRKLQEHNDPVTCCKELVDEALRRKSSDNISVVVVCFQTKPPPSLVVPRSSVHRSISVEGLKGLQNFLDGLGNEKI